MTIDKLIIGSIAKYNHANMMLRDLIPIWIEQSNKISLDKISFDIDEPYAPELPPDNVNMPLLAGDIFHNLRCALEYIYLALYIHKIGREQRRVQFPSNRNEIGNSALKVELNQLFDKHENTITTLAAGNNQDKHRILIFALPRLEPLNVDTTDGTVKLIASTPPAKWHDASVPKAFPLGTAIRTRYVMLIDKYKDRDEIHLTIDEFKALVLDIGMCLETMRQWIVDTTSPACPEHGGP